MMPVRRSTRRKFSARRPDASISDKEEDESKASFEEILSESGEEWRPDSKSKSHSGKEWPLASSTDSDSAKADESNSRPQEPPRNKRKIDREASREIESLSGSSLDQGRRREQPYSQEGKDSIDNQEAEYEQLQPGVEEAWAQMRAQKTVTAATQGTQQQPTSEKPQIRHKSRNKGATMTLNAWLGLSPVPWPTSSESARVTDRDSLFIGFVYPMAASSAMIISQSVQHLGSVVHPNLPSSIFPPAFSHLDPKRRGATHDIHAWRVLELKRGRNGLGGPNDYGIEEGHEDDGEKWGGEKVLRAMKEMGAVDLLVVVSRWYGGTNLGPVRFEHILHCAREALRAHMVEETVAPLRQELQDLDMKVAHLRASLANHNRKEPSQDIESHGKASPAFSPTVGSKTQNVTSIQISAVSAYTDLDVEKVQRLITARQKTIELLTRRLTAAPVGRPDS